MFYIFSKYVAYPFIAQKGNKKFHFDRVQLIDCSGVNLSYLIVWSSQDLLVSCVK